MIHIAFCLDLTKDDDDDANLVYFILLTTQI